MGFLDTIGRVFRPDVPAAPHRPVAGAKRKASEQGGRPPKSRKPSQIRPEPSYFGNNYQDADLYEGHAREQYLRRSTGTSFDFGQVQTILEQGSKDKDLPRTIIKCVGIDANALKQVLQSLPQEDQAPATEGVVEILSQYPETKATARKLSNPHFLNIDVPEAIDPEPVDLEPVIEEAGPSTAPQRKRSSTVSMAETQWDNEPNTRARKVLAASDNDIVVAGKAIKKDSFLTEPEYAFRDIEIRDAVWEIMNNINALAKYHFVFNDSRNAAKDRKKLTEAFRSMKPETVNIIRVLGSGGPGGQDGWRDLFLDAEKRKALVCAIIGKVLVQQVYKHNFFGGSKENLDELDSIAREHSEDGGFERHALYASYLQTALHHTGQSFSKITLPSEFDTHVKIIVDALNTHLAPLYAITTDCIDLQLLQQDLYKIVSEAGILSLLMRLDPHTVYYFVPVSKETDYDSSDMECYNEEAMRATHPRTRTTWPDSYTAAEKSRAKGDKPLTQIAIHDGLTAYRPGGWETKDSTPWNVIHGKGMSENQGVRSRLLAQGWVYCRWGRDAKAPKAAHGTQWKEPGFVNFTDVEGVPMPTVKKGRRFSAAKGSGSRRTTL